MPQGDKKDDEEDDDDGFDYYDYDWSMITTLLGNSDDWFEIITQKTTLTISIHNISWNDILW